MEESSTSRGRLPSIQPSTWKRPPRGYLSGFWCVTCPWPRPGTGCLYFGSCGKSMWSEACIRAPLQSLSTDLHSSSAEFSGRARLQIGVYRSGSNYLILSTVLYRISKLATFITTRKIANPARSCMILSSGAPFYHPKRHGSTQSWAVLYHETVGAINYKSALETSYMGMSFGTLLQILGGCDCFGPRTSQWRHWQEISIKCKYTN